MEKRLVYRVFYKSKPVYDIFDDGSVKLIRTGESCEYPSKERVDEMEKELRGRASEWENLRSDRPFEKPPFNNILERRALRRRVMKFGVSPVLTGISYDSPIDEDVPAFSTLALLGCAPKETFREINLMINDDLGYDEPYYDEVDKKYDVDRSEIAVQYFGNADKPWEVVDYDKLRSEGTIVN